ncbi:uncharacterized protein [Clytia hemisphaerica]|uniref:Mab-21-like HhH/H2TH-like domain-containing protein n=1 Tax=Clytia hemisphaerica TaxID=252671 RepID=A0A7M5XIJ0_9CNID|eukprot:TCONS_00022107-protein
MIWYYGLVTVLFVSSWISKSQGTVDQHLIQQMSELLQFENNCTETLKNAIISAKNLQQDPNYRLLKNIFKNNNSKKYFKLPRNSHLYGSFHELSGGYSARLFQSVGTLQKTCSILSNSTVNSCIDRRVDTRLSEDQWVDIDHALYVDIPSSAKLLISDVPAKRGYVTIKSSDRILRKMTKDKKEKRVKLVKKFVTVDGYLSSVKLIDNTYRNNARGLKLKNGYLEPIIQDIFEKDVSYKASTSKSRRLILYELTWRETIKMNNDRRENKKDGQVEPSQYYQQDVWRVKSNSIHLFRTQWWPTVANEWKTRDRAWPKKELIHQMTRYAFLKPTSIDKHFKYRFTHIEKLLTGLRTPDQNLNLFILKVLFYKFVKPISPNTLQTFTVKSTMMWACEQYPPDHPWWKIDKGCTPLKMVYYMLERMRVDFQRDHLADYFLPSNNVIKRTSDATRRKIVNVLTELIQTRNLLTLISSDDIANAKNIIARTRKTLKTADDFVQKGLEDGLLITLSRKPKLLVRLTKNKVRNRIKKSGLLSKIGYILFVTSFPILCGLFYCFITKFVLKRK